MDLLLAALETTIKTEVFSEPETILQATELSVETERILNSDKETEALSSALLPRMTDSKQPPLVVCKHKNYLSSCPTCTQCLHGTGNKNTCPTCILNSNATRAGRCIHNKPKR